MCNNNITLITASSFKELKHLEDDWDRIVFENDCNIYMSYDWCRIWWDYYGDDKELMVFVFKNVI